jgi:hypothetical protein
MNRIKYCVILVIAGLVIGMLGACSGDDVTTVEEEPTMSELVVENAEEARDAVLDYLREQDPRNAPDKDIVWEGTIITPSGLVGSTTEEYTSGGWVIDVAYPIVLPENTVYQVRVSGINMGWYWKGNVKADGSINEINPFQKMTQEGSEKIAREFVENSATFVFDGIEDTLELTETMVLRCPYCWVFIYEFDSRHAGYGDRAEEMLAQVITHHKAMISVIQYEVTSAIMDEQWDMIRQEITGIGEVIEVAELLANPVYDTTVKIQGIVSGLNEFLCPCFELTSGREKVMVWYDLMVENDGTQRPPANHEEFNNGDTVIVIGELKGEGGTHYSKRDFWATEIIKVTSTTPEDDIEIRLAPIHDLQVNIAESYPPQVFVYIKGGLSDGCTTFHETTEERSGNIINITVKTQRPKDVECTQVYGYFEKNLNLGTDFISGQTYTINVNNEVISFVMQ